MRAARLEILVEPFKVNDPGPHVHAALQVLSGAGLKYDMGPFSTTVDGSMDELVAVVEPLLRAGFEAGASNIQTRLECR